MIKEGFGEVMIKNIRPEWFEYYLKYNELKSRLKVVKREFGLKKAVSTRSLTGETRTFAEILDEEVEKVVLFFLRRQGELARQVWDIRSTQDSVLRRDGITIKMIDEICDKYREIGKEVVALLEYLDLNINGLRKILQMHDKLFDLRMSTLYLDSRLSTDSQHSQLLQLYHQEGLTAIIGTIRRGFEDLHEAKDALCNPVGSINNFTHVLIPAVGAAGNLSKSNSTIKLIPRTPFRAHHRQQQQQMELHGGTPNSVRRSAASSHSISEIEPILNQIYEVSQRTSSSQSNTVNEYIATHSEIALDNAVYDMRHDDLDFDDIDTIIPLKPEIQTSTLGLYLNLMATFAYMMNLYVVAPTSGAYSKELGGSQTLGALIVGMTPLAALISTFLFSIWTNYSFKQPLLVSIVFLVLGNLFYAMALQCGQLWMVIFGRFLTGIGASRGISRRYIADHVTLKDRTAASSAFVTYGALGLAAGPLLSSLLTRLQVHFTIRLFGIPVLLFETVTAPGWIMTFIWIAFLFVTFHFFVDPQIVVYPPTKTTTSHQNKNYSAVPSTAATNTTTTVPPQRVTTHNNSNRYQNETNTLLSKSEKPDSSNTQLSTSPPISTTSNGVKGSSSRYNSIGYTGNSSSTSTMNNQISIEMIPSNYIYNTSGTVGKNTYDSPITSSTSSMGKYYNGNDKDDNSKLSGKISRTLEYHDNNNNDIEEDFWGGVVVSEPVLLYDDIDSHGSGMMGRGRGTSSWFDCWYRWIFCHHYRTHPKEPGCWGDWSVEVVVILIFYVINKCNQEMLVSSSPTVSLALFHWSGESAGYAMALMALIVLPFNVLVGRCSRGWEDRDVAVALGVGCTINSALLVAYPNCSYTTFQYVVGSCLLFGTLNAQEGVSMSLLSKLLSPQLARGTFNSGLLSTEAGTLGRVFADMFISTFSEVALQQGTSNLVNTLYLPVMIGTALTLIMTIRLHSKLEV